jgi:outer membrane protein OmpA-like peptidoglycan-associated protein
MRAFLVFIVFIIFALVSRWYFVCKIRGLCDGGRPFTLALLDDDGTVLLKGYEQFAFDTTKVSPLLTDNNKKFLVAVANYLNQHNSKDITITGFYRPSEANLRMSSGFFENIGVARADRIRLLLVRNGVEEVRIKLDYQQYADELLLEPLVFQLFLNAQPSAFERTAFKFTDMTYSDANFEYNSTEFRPGERFVAYADSVKLFLTQNPGKIVRIIGHTDSIGSDAYNDPLGLERASNAKFYFERLGVTSEIIVESFGKKKPVAPNSLSTGEDNPEGRQKNRRVNFVIE